MESIEYLKKHREKEGISFRKMAKKAGVSDGYWYILFDKDMPPTLEKAAQIATGTNIDLELFLNIVFRDRMLKFLEKEKLNDNNTTAEIKKIVEVFERWNPKTQKLRDVIRYIMSTNGLKNPLTTADISSIISYLGESKKLSHKTFLNGERKKEDEGGMLRDFVPRGSSRHSF